MSSRQKNNTMESLGAVLRRIMRDNNNKLVEAVLFNKLKDSWPRIAEGELVKRSEIIDYKNYCLVIGVENPVWAQQLVFYKTKIIDKYKELYPKILIKDTKTQNVNKLSPVEIELNQETLTLDEQKIKKEQLKYRR